MGPEAEHIFNSFQFAPPPDNPGDGYVPEQDNYNTVLQKFDNHFVPKVNTIHERACFHQRSQKAGESVETYVRTLYELAETCNFGDQKKEHIRDRLVVGLQNKELSERLQLKADLTLETAIDMARTSEMVKGQIASQDAKSVEAISKRFAKTHVSSPKKSPWKKPGSTPQQKQFPQKKQSPHYQTGPECSRCGRHHGRWCPARNKQCRKCGKYGHFDVKCLSTSVKEVTTGDQAEATEVYFLGSVFVEDTEKAWEVTLDVNNNPVTFKVDCGADITVISEDTYNKMQNKPKLTPSSVKVASPGCRVPNKGQFRARTLYQGENYEFQVVVSAVNSISKPSNLLSRSVSARMGLVTFLGDVNFDGVFGDIGLMKTDPVSITLKDDATPYSVSTPRRIPFPLLPKVEEELKRMVAAGVIEEITEPTDWCAPMVPVVKKNGKVRICVDLRRLNEAVKRENFFLPTLEDIAPKLAGAVVFSTLDAASGYYQLPLSPESQKLCCFLTPFGRFVFKRLPFGVKCASEIFQRKMNELLDGIRAEPIMDDILVFGKSDDDHDENLESTLHAIRESGLKLNKEKCKFKQEKIEYFGHEISKDGIGPAQDKVKAVLDLEPPTSVSELRHVMGLINYLGKFLPDLSEVLHPVTELLKNNVAWYWGPQQQEAFDRVKTMITRAPVLTYYDAKLPTVVSADASSYGLGAVLLQQHQDRLKPVAFASRTLTEAEKRYAQVEKECLASVWACEKFDRYLRGLDSFKVLTDHKPLVPMINTMDLDKAPLRCQRLLMRLLKYSIKAEYVPGKDMVVPDVLSRSPRMNQDKPDLSDEVDAYVAGIEASWPASKDKLCQIRDATHKDALLVQAMNFTLHGWPAQSAVPPDLLPLYKVRNELSVTDGLLVFRARIVVPEALQEDILDRIHDGHLGIMKCQERARTSVWWPGINQRIQQKIAACKHCIVEKPTQRKEPLMTSTLPDRPWERVAADLCEYDGHHYLIVVDYYSRFIEIPHLENMTSAQVIGKLKAMFARWGIPSVLVSDNGTQFSSSVFQEFAASYGFTHLTSSPHYPQANGAVERAVQTAKKILKQKDPFIALMAYRDSPVAATGYSPAELMMGRRISTKIPMLPQNLKPKWPSHSVVQCADQKAKSDYEFYYNRRNSARPLPQLQPGDTVRVKTDQEKRWNTPATVVSASAPRSYVVQTPRGTLRRNRRHLQKVPTSANESLPETLSVLPMDTYEPVVPVVEEPQPEIPSPTEVTRNAVPSAAMPTGGTTVTAPTTPVRTSSGRVVKKPSKFKDFV